MNFLTGLGNFAGGVTKGMDQGSVIKQRAMQVQQAQLALDQQKKDIAAQAAAFAGINPGGGAPPTPGMTAPGAPPPGPMAQPMAPGQPSMPAQQQAGPQLPPQLAGPSAAPMAPPPQQPLVSPPGGPAPAPSQGAGAPPQSGQIDPTDPMAGTKVVTQIAQEIKSRNPNIDPQQLLMATQHVIDMSKGMAPALRSGAQVVVQQLRDASSERNTDVRANQSDVNNQRTTTTSSANTDKRTSSQEKIAAGHDQTSLSRAATVAGAAMDRAKFVQGEVNKRASTNQGDKNKNAAINERTKTVVAQLTAATRKLALLKDATGSPLPETDPRVQQAMKEIETANKNLDIISKAAGIPASASPAPEAGGAELPPDLPSPKGHAEGSTLKSGDKVIAVLKNGAWAAP